MKKLGFSTILTLTGVIVAFNCHAQENNSRQQTFEHRDGLTRVIEEGSYRFYDDKQKMILDLDHFKFVSDFSEGVAVVKGAGAESYGAINKQGQLALDTVWYDIKPSSAGYLLVARKVDGFVIEDRGEGEKEYPKVGWRFVQGTTGNILDELEFKVILNVNGLASGEDHEGKTYLIDVYQLNPGLYDPFMKAMLEINKREVFSVVDKVFGTIVYKYRDTRKNALSYPYNKDPFAKYNLTWQDESLPLDQGQ